MNTNQKQETLSLASSQDDLSGSQASPKTQSTTTTPGYKFTDLREDPSDDLLNKFYYDLMVPSFPIQDELDPLEKWVQLLNWKNDKGASSLNEIPDFHVLICQENGIMMGGVVFEYYIQINCGLLTYLIVNPKIRSKGLGNVLARKCIESLEANAKSRGHLAGCNAIFLETNSATRVKENDDVMNPALRHRIFHRMGLRLVDFDYVQPPLWRNKKKVNFLLLCVFVTPRIPQVEMGDSTFYYLPSQLLKNVMRSFWTYSARLTGHKFLEDVDYKRMMDQLKRREKILLLDLPWERPFTIVDLKDHFDLELLVQYYTEILLPSYQTRKDELESLDIWISTLSAQNKNNEGDFHVLLALKYSQDEEENPKPRVAGGLIFEYYHNSNCGLLSYLMVPEGERGERMARVLVEYATDALDKDAMSRGHPAGCNVIYIETGSEAEERKTKAIKNSETQTEFGTMEEFTDISQRHQILEKMGWRLLDFDYVQPPVSTEFKKCKSLFLCVYVTPRIPKILQGDIDYLFLPRQTVKNNVEGMWKAACARVGYNYVRDTDYRRMMDQIERREKIPLLDRPWVRLWTILDLSEDYDVELLKSFYDNLLRATVADDELDSIETWLERFSPQNTEKLSDFHVLLAIHYPNNEDKPSILAGITLRYFPITSTGLILRLITRENEQKEAVTKALVNRAVDILNQNAIVNGHLAGCNVIFLQMRLDQKHSSTLTEYEKAEKEPLKVSITHKSGTSQSTSTPQLPPTPAVLPVPVISAATPSSSTSPSPSPPITTTPMGPLSLGLGYNNLSLGVEKKSKSTTASAAHHLVPQSLSKITNIGKAIDMTTDHQLLEDMGWRLLDFKYVSPPPFKASVGQPTMKTKSTSLCVFLTPNIPHSPSNFGYTWHFLHRPIMLNFIREMWSTYCPRTFDIESDIDFRMMLDSIKRREKILLLEQPWERSWTLIDLWEDPDVELLYKFYQNFAVQAFPDKADRVPLSDWILLLSDTIQDNPSYDDFHLILSLHYPPKSVRPSILGGLSLTYFTTCNCGLLADMLLRKDLGLSTIIMARSLMEEAVDALNDNALDRGHIAGCNAIFMELCPPPANSSDVLVFQDRQNLQLMGWRMLSPFSYVSPPKSIHSSMTNRQTPPLLALLRPFTPRENKNGKAVHYLPKDLVVNFLQVYYYNLYQRSGRSLAKDVEFKSMIQQLVAIDKFYLLDIPSAKL